jgi:hypothetical protein
VIGTAPDPSATEIARITRRRTPAPLYGCCGDRVDDPVDVSTDAVLLDNIAATRAEHAGMAPQIFVVCACAVR